MNYANNLADVNYTASVHCAATSSAFERPRINALAVDKCDVTNEAVTTGTDYDSSSIWVQVIGGN